MAFSILVVCTANICRSPTAAIALRRGLRAAGITEQTVQVSSAGVFAMAGRPQCEVAEARSRGALSALPADPADAHASRPLVEEDLFEAGLILTADRGHRREVIARLPRARARVFTLRQGARLATWVATDGHVLEVAIEKARGTLRALEPTDPMRGVPPLPGAASERLAWLAAEMDAARGQAPTTDQARWPLWDVDDIADPHTSGFDLHPDAVECVLDSAAALVSAIEAVLQAPQ